MMSNFEYIQHIHLENLVEEDFPGEGKRKREGEGSLEWTMWLCLDSSLVRMKVSLMASTCVYVCRQLPNVRCLFEHIERLFCHRFGRRDGRGFGASMYVHMGCGFFKRMKMSGRLFGRSPLYVDI
jgi:hypothetical protein